VSTRNLTPANRPVSLLILEGETESVFYPLIRDKFLASTRVELWQVHSGSNINKQVLSKIFTYTYRNPEDLVRVYCCSDTDRNKLRATPLDIEYTRETVKTRSSMTNVLSVTAIMADPEIESWFFYDIDGIYRFLRAQRSQRNPEKFKNPRSLGKKDLERLFEHFGKVYVSGERAENFIMHLDILKIISQCTELREGIELIKKQANDATNHLFQAVR